MNPIKSNRSALWALAAAGGLWAWRNRDKIQSWINTQRDQMSGQYGSATTGPTRRIGEGGYTSSSPRIYDDRLGHQE